MSNFNIKNVSFFPPAFALASEEVKKEATQSKVSILTLKSVFPCEIRLRRL